MTPQENQPLQSVVDHKGNVFYTPGSKSQLMTPLYKLFILFSQPVFTLINHYIPAFGWLITLILYTWWFIADRDLLKKENAFVPSAWWFLFNPVYIYKRQNRNGNSRIWFLWFVVSGLLTTIMLSVYIAAQSSDTQ